jgi:transposase
MTTPESHLARFVLLPELVLLPHARPRTGFVHCEKRFEPQACTRCGTMSSASYDRRRVMLKDVPYNAEVGTRPMRIILHKRRLWCKPCGRAFTESVPGCLPRRRTTERFRKLIMWACERYVSLSQVCREFGVSSDFVYTAFYEQLELKRRKDNQYPWPTAIGIDEHGFGRHQDYGRKAFVSVIVNQSKGKVMEVTFGKSQAELEARLAHIPGRENVRFASIDMCDPYRNFIRSFFPNAQIVADKFHVLRLLSVPILKERKRIVGKNADRRARGLLLCSSKRLDYLDRLAIHRYLQKHPELLEMYMAKEALHGFYRTRGQRRAEVAFERMKERFLASPVAEVRRLGRTLVNWRVEILNYFKTRMTNARLEGFNNKCSLVRRRAYGYRNPNNYRLRILSVCS